MRGTGLVVEEQGEGVGAADYVHVAELGALDVHGEPRLAQVDQHGGRVAGLGGGGLEAVLCGVVRCSAGSGGGGGDEDEDEEEKLKQT